MNNQLILLLDCPYICHRVYHAFGDALTFGDQPTAVVYGFLQEVIRLQAEFETDKIAFAFDFGLGKRKELLPTYKSSRAKAHEDDTEEEQQSRRNFYLQVRRLREQYLQQLGYRNVFALDGYEADDVLASVVKMSLKDDERAVIVSSDQDLWQCINANVSCYNPQTKALTDRKVFMSRWGIEPCLWANVKALAGCTGDDVPGIRGIGELTAAKWFQCKLKESSAAYKKINGTEGLETHNRNIRLVRLPFEGCQRFELRQDEVTAERWVELADRLGMKSLRDVAPGMPRGVKRPGEVVKKRSAVGFGF
jgi:5'-3' exonuclease